MLTFASTSLGLLVTMLSSQFEYVKSVFYNNDKNMFFTDFSTSSDDPITPSEFADDFGFFDDFDTSHHNISDIGYEIGTKLAAMCDEFDAQMMSYSKRCDSSRNLLSRVLDFFSF